MSMDVDRLARYVLARRQELGLSQLEVQGRGGPSDTTLGKIEAATGSVNRQTLEKLDVGLGWQLGSARRVLEGGEPEEAPAPEPEMLEVVNRGRAARARVVHRGLRESSYDELWQEWADLFIASLSIEMEYARRRGMDPAAARQELWDVLAMAQQSREGRPWVPPWEELSDDEAQDHIEEMRQAGLLDDEAGGQLLDLARPPMPDLSKVAARRGESEGRRARQQQDEDAET